MAKNKNTNNKIISINLPQKGKKSLPLGKAMQFAAAWSKQKKYSFVISVLTQITEQLPSYTPAWSLLFDSLEKQGDMEALEKTSTACLSKKSRFVPALMSLAIAQRMRLQHEDAFDTIKKAIKIEPRNSELYNILGIIYKEQGENELALEAFNKCLSINPKHSSSIWNKSDLPNAITNQEFDTILSLAESGKTSKREQAKLYFSLARSKNEAVTYTKEFELINKGSELMSSMVNYNHQDELTLINAVSKYFKQDTGSIETNSLESCPIFICGLPRSGTTLVEQILSSHTDITAGDELNDLPIATSKVLKRNFIKSAFPEWANQLESEDWQQIADFYLDTTKAFHSARYFTDKNLMNYKSIGVIRRALPQAKIIVCKRDPMDNIWGCYRQYFSNGLIFTYKLEELAEIVKAHNALIDHWKSIGVPLLEVQYEELVSNPEAKIKKLIDYIGLDFREDCLKFYENKRNVRTTSATQVRQPLSNKKVGYWKYYQEQLEHIAQLFK